MRLDYIKLKDYLYYVFVSFIMLLLFINIVTINGFFLRGSIINYKNVKSDEFDGTVYPIEYVPDPFVLTYDERKQNYSDIDSKYFIKIPEYDPLIFGQNPDFLDPGSIEYQNTVTQRLIYTIPYLSTYNFDYKEYSGSHPGVDIIAPEGTPIKNIANGVVVEVNYGTANFGNYVVVRHDNVPLLYGKTSTVYSLYGHMSSISVEEGTKISKGTLIGEVGHSGIATTDHLHFQIDLEAAPFHPYWPFSGDDMRKAGVDFFDAVNIGLGKKNAIIYTMNPLKFINRNKNYTKLSDIAFATDILKGNNPGKTDKKETKNDEKNIITENKIEDKSEDLLIEDKNIESNNKENIEYIEEKNLETTGEELVDIDSKELEKEVIKENKEVEITKEDNSTKGLFSNLVQDVNTSKINTNSQKLLKNDDDFALLSNIELAVLGNTGVGKNNTQDEEKIYDTIIVNDDNSKKYIEENIDLNTSLVKNISNENDINSIDEEKTITNSNNTIESQEDLNIAEENNLEEKIIENNSDIINNEKLFSDIDTDYKYYDELKYFKENNIISGFTDDTFRSLENITRAEALKMILLSYNVEISESNIQIYYDVDKNSWINNYVNTAIENNLIDKNSDYFNPNGYISRVEFVKILSKLENIKIINYENNDNKINDIDLGSWEYKYMNYAFESNLFDLNNENIYPYQNLNREEFISIMYNYLNN